MELVVFKDTPVRLPSRRLARLFDLVTAREGKKHWKGSVNLVLTTDRGITDLNSRFRSQDRPTDVLSFNIDPPEEPGAIFGEIYISVPYVRRQARKYGRGLWDELLLLVCHGLLHLFGYDHAARRDEKAMFARQQDYLNRLREVG